MLILRQHSLWTATMMKVVKIQPFFYITRTTFSKKVNDYHSKRFLYFQTIGLDTLTGVVQGGVLEFATLCNDWQALRKNQISLFAPLIFK